MKTGIALMEEAFVYAMDEVVNSGKGGETNIYQNIADHSLVIDIAGQVAIINQQEQMKGEEKVRSIVRLLIG